MADGDSDLGCVIDVARDFGDVKQRFGRNAAPVEAHAANLVAIDANDVLPKLSQTNRGVISARTRSDDDRINRFVSHSDTLFHVSENPRMQRIAS